MLQELINLDKGQPDTRPEGFGSSIVAHPRSGSCSDLLLKIKTTWTAIAGWGRWCDDDDDLPDFSNEEFRKQMPDWLLQAFDKRLYILKPLYIFDNWVYDLIDRDWIWWSGAIVVDCVKIDVESQSMPISMSALRIVMEQAGGEILYAGDWIAGEAFSSTS